MLIAGGNLVSLYVLGKRKLPLKLSVESFPCSTEFGIYRGFSAA